MGHLAVVWPGTDISLLESQISRKDALEPKLWTQAEIANVILHSEWYLLLPQCIRIVAA